MSYWKLELTLDLRTTGEHHACHDVDGSVVKQLLLVEGLVGPGELVSKPRSTWRDMAVAAMSAVHVLAGRVWLAGCGWQAVVDKGSFMTAHIDDPFVTAPRPLFNSCGLAALSADLPFLGSLPVTLTPRHTMSTCREGWLCYAQAV
eukprot:95198-Chlamydomonas_euryale.AAC.9